jgi:hypothetical protein
MADQQAEADMGETAATSQRTPASGRFDGLALSTGLLQAICDLERTDRGSRGARSWAGMPDAMTLSEASLATGVAPEVLGELVRGLRAGLPARQDQFASREAPEPAS